MLQYVLFIFYCNASRYSCIGSSLIRSAEISQRAILQHMADVDMVVLMGSEEAPEQEKEMIVGSKEQILYKALSMVLVFLASALFLLKLLAKIEEMVREEL